VLETRAALLKWEGLRPDEQAAEALKIRRALGRLGALVEDLDQESEWAECTTREIESRHNKIAMYKEQRAELQRKLKSGPDTPSTAQDVAKYNDLSTNELVSLHRVNIREQDEVLDQLADSVVRSRIVGEQIGQEATESTRLLQHVGGQTDRTGERVRKESEAIQKLEVDGANITCYVVIGLLVIALIIVLATDGGCYIVMSKASCAAKSTPPPHNKTLASVSSGASWLGLGWMLLLGLLAAAVL